MDASRAAERFRRYPIPHTELTRIPATNDQNRFYAPDPIRASEDCGTTPTQGFRPSSKNVKRPVTHTKGIEGITGGHVAGATIDPASSQWGHAAPIAARRAGKRGTIAAKRAAKRRVVLAALRERGYAV